MPTNYAQGGSLPVPITNIVAWQAIAANAAPVKSTELTCTGYKYARFLIEFGLDSTTTPVGTQFLIQRSGSATGDRDWVTMDTIITGTVAATAFVTDGDEAAGQTEIATGAAVPDLNDMVFFKNGTITNSEIGRVVGRDVTGGSEHFDLLDGLTTLQAGGTYYNKAEKYDRLYILTGATRVRVVVNNNYAASSAACNIRVSCVLQND